MIKRNKKSQVEIMGLIVIVILLAVAMIFILQFTISRRPTTIKTYSHAEIAENTLTAMLQTTTNCDGLTISELLKKCAEPIPEYRGYCDCLDRTVDDILSKTLDEWNIEYRLSATIEPGQVYINKSDKIPDSCLGERKSATHIISAAGQIMRIRMDVCG
ncbi:hypothetical protein KY342_01770 [Candidatus Woesearchaeota archaeon]|nr:hypothetical protein [Candidatus Woesearchaeota archaeon]